jgi:hypothetical protein
MEDVIEPGEFARILKTGGRANGNIVTGIWFQGGRNARENGATYAFDQAINAAAKVAVNPRSPAR